jgi:hypothetical protein
MKYFSLVDYLYGPIALLIIIIFARIIKYRRIETNPEYAYFTKGLYAKILGGLSLCFVYTLYYGGGDTVNYFNDATAVMRLLFYNPYGFFDIMTNGLTWNNFYHFNENTGYPIYWRDDQATFWVVRVTAPFVIFAAGSFIVSTLIFALISYVGTWKLYKVFIMEFPDLKKEMAIAILFIPSVFFWGSGILKDTITLACVGFYTYSFYMLLIRREKMFWNSITIFISSYLILSIKPYIIFALLPGSIIWFVNKHIGAIRSGFIRVLLGPFLLTLAIAGGYFMLANMSGILGHYSLENVMEKAVITNQDLKADYYGGNSFDIGDFEPTIPSMLSKAPAAINAAIFRPYLWEANNIVMLASGLENFIILIFTLMVLIRIRIFGFLPFLAKQHLLSFSLIFSLFFAFSVGISTSNFGSLVRYKIPVIPFFIASLFIMRYLYVRRNVEEEQPKVAAEESDDEVKGALPA